MSQADQDAAANISAELGEAATTLHRLAANLASAGVRSEDVDAVTEVAAKLAGIQATADAMVPSKTEPAPEPETDQPAVPDDLDHPRAP